MISADDYIVQVQDFGELLEYRYNDYARARHLMDNQSGELEGLPNERSDAASRKPTGFLQNGGGRHGRI